MPILFLVLHCVQLVTTAAAFPYKLQLQHDNNNG